MRRGCLGNRINGKCCAYALHACFRQLHKQFVVDGGHTYAECHVADYLDYLDVCCAARRAGCAVHAGLLQLAFTFVTFAVAHCTYRSFPMAVCWQVCI